MSWLWVTYIEIAPFLHYLAFVLSILIVLILLRPFVLYYFRINQRMALSREQIRLQKKILEEMQFLRHSAGKKMSPSTSSVSFPDEEERLSAMDAEEPILIELKKDPQ